MPNLGPFLIVGLGNPGPKYALTFHNLGFLVVDLLASRWNAGSFTSKFHGHLGETIRGGRKILLLKPQTFMNRSGLSVAETVTFYKIPPEDLLVITDDLDLPPAAMRIRLTGGAGGHNGLKSINESIGTEKFPRVRLGIGRSAFAAPDAHVLSTIPKADQSLFAELVARGADAVESI